MSCLFWRFIFWVFLIEWLRGLFFLIVWFDWWDSLSCLFWRFVFWVFLIEWLCGLFVDVILFWFFVERLWFCAKEEKLWSDGALQCCRCWTLRKNECGLIQTVDLLIWACIVCCENAFVFWTSFLRAAQVELFAK